MHRRPTEGLKMLESCSIPEASHTQTLCHDRHAKTPSGDLQHEAAAQICLHAAICCLAC